MDTDWIGYARMVGDDKMEANCSCTLVRSEEKVIIVDTMTPWDQGFINEKLR